MLAYKNLQLRSSLQKIKSASETCFNLSRSSSSKPVDQKFRSDQSKPWINFALAKHGNFYQEKPVIHNQFVGDAFLQKYLRKVLPKEVLAEITPDLTRFGDRVATDIHELGRACDVDLPRLVVQDAWGRVVNQLHLCEAWKKQHDIAAEEGIVAIGYERKFHEWSRLYQFAKLYLYAPSSGLYTCPVAMVDGAAKVIESKGLKQDPIFKEAFNHLTSRDPKKFWTSGQWMTEKGGGSDVGGGTETVAIPQPDGTYRLFGYKWFSSATDADMSITLARIADEDGHVLQGTSGLTLFYLKVRNENGDLNNINMIRLKDKLGTRQVPTAELLLDGALAYKMSEEGRGVASISNMLQITRFHNAIGSSSAMRRILSIARDYATKRKAFGKPIAQYPLHMQVLAQMDLEARGSFILSFEAIRLLGKQECGFATDEEVLLLRLLNPLTKLFVCKQSISVISEGLEAMGGQGAMEDTALPVMLRDSQINVIWEGTTNVLAMDVIRSLAKSNGQVLEAFRTFINSRLDLVDSFDNLKQEASKLKDVLDKINKIVQENPSVLEFGARDFAFNLASIFIGASLLEMSCAQGSTNLDQMIAKRWCQRQDIDKFVVNYKLNIYNSTTYKNDFDLVMENY